MNERGLNQSLRHSHHGEINRTVSTLIPFLSLLSDHTLKFFIVQERHLVGGCLTRGGSSTFGEVRDLIFDGWEHQRDQGGATVCTSVRGHVHKERPDFSSGRIRWLRLETRSSRKNNQISLADIARMVTYRDAMMRPR
jgi:hypothetical protein